MSNLVNHAKFELEAARLFSPDADYEGMLGNSVMELVETFAKQGHSGMSAAITLDIFTRVASFKPLTPIGASPDEWNEVGTGVWQNRRRSTTFSRDGGDTWYDIDDATLNNGDQWVHSEE
jgi:hypothetical protein